MDEALSTDRWIDRVIRRLDRFISPEILDGGEPSLTRSRMLLVLAVFLAFVSLLSSVTQLALGEPLLALPGGIMAVIVAFVPSMLRRARSHVAIGGIFTAAIFLGVNLAIAMTAGRAVIAVVFLAALPLIGSLSQNFRWGLVWSVVVLAELALLHAVVLAGVEPMIDPDPLALETAYLRGSLLVAVIVSAGCAVYGLLSDYSLHRAAESERHLEENRRRFLEMFHASPDGLFSVAQGRVDFVSRALVDLLGYTHARELHGVLLQDIVKGIEVDLLVDGSKPIEDTRYLACQMRAADGATIDVEVATSRFQIDGYRGQVLRVRDRRALRAADREVRMVRAAFEQAPVGMAILELDSEIVYANDAFLELVAIGREEIMGSKLLDLSRTPEAHAFLLEIQAAVARGELVSAPKTDSTRFGGRPGFMDIRAFSILPEAEGVARWVIFVREVTRFVELEREVARSERIDSLGKLAGGIAHDFNNLLTVIMGQVDHLDEALGSEHWSHETLNTIMDACERSAALTSKILDFSRKQALRPEIFLTDEALWDIFPILRQMVPERIRLEMSIAEESSSPRVRCDPIRFEQIVLNLISNARDAIPDEGTISIGVRVVESEAGSGSKSGGIEEVEIFVRDDGLGMTRDVSDRIFDPFFTTKPSGVGTGLGLSTVHGIVHQSGGRIEVDSEPGRGTAIRVLLPKSLAALTPKSELEPVDPEALAASTGLVLVVEDNPAVRALMSGSLERMGYSVVAAQDGDEARAWIEDRGVDFDALVSDIVMPGTSGVELARLFRSRFEECRIVLVSGYAEDEIGPIEHLPGEIRFVQKPMTARSLAEALLSGDARVAASPARSAQAAGA